MVINITDKLSNEKPSIQIGDKTYLVNDSMSVVLKFEELSNIKTSDSMLESIKITLGEDTCNELDLENWSIPNFQVLVIAILATVQGVSYEEAEAMFQGK